MEEKHRAALNGRVIMDRFCVEEFLVDPRCNKVIGPGGSAVRLEPKVMELLCVLAQRPGEVISRDELADEIWRGSFGTDERLTRAISRLRNVFGDTRGEPRFIETIPKRGYRLVAPVTEAAAPGKAGERASGRRDDELAPLAAPASGPKGRSDAIAGNHGEGQSTRSPISDGTDADNEKASDAHERVSRPSYAILSRRPLMAAAAVAGMGLLIAAFMAFRGALSPASDTIAWNSIEAGPINVMAGNADDPKLVALAESLSTYFPPFLSRHNFDVVPPGAKRKATFHLTGTVERYGGRIGVMLQLQDAASDLPLWSRNFTFDEAPTALIRDPVASMAAGVLGCAIAFGQPDRETPSEVLRAYFRFCDAANDRTNTWALSTYTKRVVELDPENPRAVGMHAFILTIAGRGFDKANKSMTEEHARRRAHAQELVKRTLDLDPDNPLALTIQAVNLVWSSRIAESESLLLRARKVDGWPDRRTGADRLSIPDLQYGGILAMVGRLREARDIYRKAVVANPLDLRSRLRLAQIQFALSYTESARAHFEFAERNFPHRKGLLRRRSYIEMFTGDPAPAIARLDRYPQSEQTKKCLRTYGREWKRERRDFSAVETACMHTSRYTRFLVFACLGELDRAYEIVRAATPVRDSIEWSLFVPPCVRQFRRDPRFWPVAKRFGLVDYRLETGYWPDFCREPDLPFDCKERALAVSGKEAARHR